MGYAGYLPKSITYVCSAGYDIEIGFDDADDVDTIASCKVIPTFPVETGKKLDTAIKWTGLKSPKIIETENLPIKNVKIVDLDYRGNGGRAYKVILDDLYYVDMREDVILECIHNCGIEKGGKINGEFVWAKYGNHMKLIRVGSSLHEKFIKSTSINALIPIAPIDLKVGGIYSDKRGFCYMYFGPHYYYQYEYDVDSGYNYFSDKVNNQRLLRKKTYLFIKLWKSEIESNKTDSGIKKLISNSNDLLYPELKSALPKNLIKLEALYNISDFDVANEIRTRIDAKIKELKNTRSLHSLSTSFATATSLGKDAPVVSELLKDLPIAKK